MSVRDVMFQVGPTCVTTWNSTRNEISWCRASERYGYAVLRLSNKWCGNLVTSRPLRETMLNKLSA